MALYQLVHLGAWAVASALGGYLADRVGIRAAMAVGALVCASAAFSTWRRGLPPSFLGSPDSV